MPTQLQRSRELAFHHQHGKCFYCGLPMLLNGDSGPPSLRCTAEHLQPRSERGRDTPENVVAAHARCNQIRHRRARPPEPAAFREQVCRRMAGGKWHPQSLRKAAEAGARAREM